MTRDLPDEVECSVGLRPDRWLATARRSKYDVLDFAVHIDLVSTNLDESCDAIGLCHDAEGWHFLGRLAVRTEARETRLGPARVIRGTVDYGRYLKGGGYQGSAEAEIAVITQGRTLVRVVADRTFRDQTVFDEIVRRTALVSQDVPR